MLIHLITGSGLSVSDSGAFPYSLHMPIPIAWSVPSGRDVSLIEMATWNELLPLCGSAVLVTSQLA